MATNRFYSEKRQTLKRSSLYSVAMGQIPRSAERISSLFFN